MKFHGQNDIAGSGQFSGRLTAPLCIAGGLCLQLLKERGIAIGAHILSIGNVDDIAFDPVNPQIGALTARQTVRAERIGLGQYAGRD